MKVICAWCNRELGEKEGPEEKVSHGMCRKCADRFLADAKRDGMKLSGKLLSSDSQRMAAPDEPLIGGGQGRSADEVAFSAKVASCCLVAIVLILAVAWVIAMFS